MFPKKERFSLFLHTYCMRKIEHMYWSYNSSAHFILRFEFKNTYKGFKNQMKYPWIQSVIACTGSVVNTIILGGLHASWNIKILKLRLLLIISTYIRQKSLWSNKLCTSPYISRRINNKLIQRSGLIIVSSTSLHEKA